MPGKEVITASDALTAYDTQQYGRIPEQRSAWGPFLSHFLVYVFF